MDTQAEPKNEADTEPVENQDTSADIQTETKVEKIMYKGQDVKKLKAEDPGNDLVRRYEEEYGEIK